MPGDMGSIILARNNSPEDFERFQELNLPDVNLPRPGGEMPQMRTMEFRDRNGNGIDDRDEATGGPAPMPGPVLMPNPPPMRAPIPNMPINVTFDNANSRDMAVFGGYGALPSMPYAGMATSQIPSIMGMAPPSYYGGSAPGEREYQGHSGLQERLRQLERASPSRPLPDTSYTNQEVF